MLDSRNEKIQKLNKNEYRFASRVTMHSLIIFMNLADTYPSIGKPIAPTSSENELSTVSLSDGCAPPIIKLYAGISERYSELYENR